MMIGPSNNSNDDDDDDNKRIIEVDDDEQDDNDNDNTENSATIDCTGADAGIVTAGFTVQGIYTRWWPTDKQKELFSPTDTVMPRRRLYTRPLEGYKNSSSDGNHRHRHLSEPWTGFHNTQKKNNIDDDEGKEEKVDNSEEEEEEEEEEEYDEYGYVRYMVPVDDDGYDVAKFAPKKGLIGGHFWHEYNEMSKTVREDRAILFQSQENYATVLLAIKEMMMMMSKKKKKKKDTTTAFPSAVGGSGASLSDDDDDDDNDVDNDNDNTSGILNKNYMEHPTFGEQVIVSGIETHELAIGDIFKIQNENDNGSGSGSTSTSTLVIEITAPRKPCGIINIKHDTRPRPGSSDGLTHYVHRHKCLGGWFARVLVEGELRDGMKFIRTSHPNPKWTLTYLYRALYWEGTTNRRDILLNASSWNRSRKELLEMINLSQLGEYEWKVEGRKLLYKLDGINWKIIQPNLIDPQLDLPLNEAESLFATSATDANDPNLVQNCLFEYICNMTETYESFADILKFFGLIKLG